MVEEGRVRWYTLAWRMPSRAGGGGGKDGEGAQRKGVQRVVTLDACTSKGLAWSTRSCAGGALGVGKLATQKGGHKRGATTSQSHRDA